MKKFRTPRLGGADSTDPAAIAADLASLRQAIADRWDEARQLGEAWLHAKSQAAAEEIERRRRELLRMAERDTALLPEIERRLADARVSRQQEALKRHFYERRDLYRRFKSIIEAAAALQDECIAADKRAIAELGESVVRRVLPTIVYRGFLTDDFVRMWERRLDRAFSAPQPQTESDAWDNPLTEYLRNAQLVEVTIAELLGGPLGITDKAKWDRGMQMRVVAYLKKVGWKREQIRSGPRRGEWVYRR